MSVLSGDCRFVTLLSPRCRPTLPTTPAGFAKGFAFSKTSRCTKSRRAEYTEQRQRAMRRKPEGISAHRPSGLAKRRLTLPLMRVTNVQFPTAFSAGILPPLRQTACYRLAFSLFLFYPCQF